MKIFPQSRAGKWAVGLNAVFFASVGVSMLLVLGLGLLDFGDRWWDITVPIIFLAAFLGWGLSIKALWQNKDQTVLVYGSVVLGVLVVLFVLLHSLFISD